jgi:hypothetical protein
VEQGASRVGGAAVVCSVGAGCGAAVAVQALLGERGEWRARRGFWWRQLAVGGCGWRGGGVSEGSELEATLSGCRRSLFGIFVGGFLVRRGRVGTIG